MSNNNVSSEDDIRKPSAPEQLIANYLDSNTILYEREYVLEKLKWDNKQFRKADFYLPYLKVYVEYFGLYNKNKEERKRYDDKVDVYIKNGIPTIFLYPEELGYLDYAFHTKIIKLLKLKKFKLRWQLWRYRRNRFWFESNRSPGIGSIISGKKL